MAVILACILLFVVLGILLLTGRGASLIAGYNTMPKRERERYDERALCRFTGRMLFAMAACMGLLLVDEFRPGEGWALAGGIWMVIITFGGIIYANTGGRFLKK